MTWEKKKKFHPFWTRAQNVYAEIREAHFCHNVQLFFLKAFLEYKTLFLNYSMFYKL